MTQLLESETPSADVAVRRFSVAEYHRMAEAGVLNEDDRVELLEGLIVQKRTHSPRHDATIQRTDDALRSRLPKGWLIRIQSVVATADSEPEPDLAIVRAPISRYADHHPTAADCLLIIEVSDTTLAQDRTRKARLYARAGFENYWIVNLPENQVELLTTPDPKASTPAYQSRLTRTPGESITLTVGRKKFLIPVAELLPAKPRTTRGA